MKPIRINQFEQPLPLWVKPILLLFAALACLAIVLIGCSPVDLPTDTATTEPVVMDVDQPHPVDTLITEISDPLADIRPQLETLTRQQATLQTHQAEQNAVVEQQQIQISALQNSVTQLRTEPGLPIIHLSCLMCGFNYQFLLENSKFDPRPKRQVNS